MQVLHDTFSLVESTNQRRCRGKSFICLRGYRSAFEWQDPFHPDEPAERIDPADLIEGKRNSFSSGENVELDRLLYLHVCNEALNTHTHAHTHE